MRRYFSLFIVFLFFAQFSFSQEMTIDFSDPSENFIGFSGSSFSFGSDPNNSGNVVGQFFNDGSFAWQGFTLDLIRSIDLDFQNIIYLSFYGFDPNSHNIVLKLENGLNPDVQVTRIVTAGGGWTDSLIFDFSNAVYTSGGATVNASGTYDKISIFIDGGLAIPGTYLIDNIDDGSIGSGTNPNTLDVVYSNLVWQDEFDIPGTVNPTNWHHQTQVIIPGAGWANNEQQHYTNRTDNSFVDNAGFLHIVAKKEIFTDQGLTKNYTSARLNSKFAFTYGRVDVRAKLPLESGTWPAIWMLGKNINENGGYWAPNFGSVGWPECGEIDIMEHGIFPGQSINYINSAIHTPCCFAANPNQGGTIASDLANEFHVYSVNWSPNQITFLLDSVGFYTYNPAVKNASTWPFFEDQFILLNVAMGGYAGTISPTFTQNPMIIDYVRVYQQEGLNVEEQNELENTTKIYPNPAQNQINISSKIIPTSVAIYDVFGQLVMRKVDGTDLVDVSKLPPGVYFVEIYFNNEKVVEKVIVD